MNLARLVSAQPRGLGIQTGMGPCRWCVAITTNHITAVRHCTAHTCLFTSQAEYTCWSSHLCNAKGCSDRRRSLDITCHTCTAETGPLKRRCWMALLTDAKNQSDQHLLRGAVFHAGKYGLDCR